MNEAPTRPVLRYHGGKWLLADWIVSHFHELSNADHEALLATLKQLRGMVVLSGYASEIYESALQGWERFERASNAAGARARMEVLWLSPSCAAAVSGRLECA